MATHIDKEDKHDLARQVSDLELLTNDTSSDESVSLEDYLNTIDEFDEIASSTSTPELTNPKNKDEDAHVQTRTYVEDPVDKRKKRLIRRKTLDEFLRKDSIMDKKVSPTDTKPDHLPSQSSDASAKVKASITLMSSEKIVEDELKYMLASETQHIKDLVELLQAKTFILNSFGKHASAGLFEVLRDLHGLQGWIVSHLENICNKKKRNIEDLIIRLCERQKVIANYAQLIVPRVRNFSVKLQSKASSSFHRYVELLQQPISWMQQTIKSIEHLKECFKMEDPNYEIITAAQNELLGISSDLVPLKQIKEPLKYSLLVELRNPPNGERKLASVFLFDNALVCARQRVIVLRKHFTHNSDSDSAPFSSNTKDQPTLVMNTKSISRYDLRWFVPLDQLKSLDCKGMALDENNLRERLQKIEALKSKITKAQRELQEETTNLDKESKRQKLKIPKIHKLRSYLYGLQAELVLQAPRLPLFVNTIDDQKFCFLLASEKERVSWTSAIAQAKSCFISMTKLQSPVPVAKRTSTVRSLSSAFLDLRGASSASKTNAKSETLAPIEGLKNELSYMINHCKTAVPLNKLGKVIISGSALSGILKVCVHEISGLTEIAPYYVAIEVDFYGQFELVAKTKIINDSKTPCWDQTFIIELDTTQTIGFTVFKHSEVLGQLEIPLERDQIDQENALYNVKTDEVFPGSVNLKISLCYNERKKSGVSTGSKKKSRVFGRPLIDVVKRNQADLESLQKQINSSMKCKEIRVPVLVTACAEEIERRGLQEEGIYRTSGTSTAIAYLQTLFDHDTALAIKQIGDYDINVISSLLKLFFRELPDPIIPESNFCELITASEINDEKEKLSEFSHILKKIPRVNLETFRYLMNHLIRVCQYESDNKMNMGNLSLIWAMTLFQPKDLPTLSPVMTDATETLDAKKISFQSIQSAASTSMQQTMILSTIFDAYAKGQLDLSTE